MNLASQELDQLRVIQRLPKDSELYEIKVRQFREMTAMRSEVEKVLQEQRLAKIRRDFEKQKLEEDRLLRQQEWIDQQKRQLVGDQPVRQPELRYPEPARILEPQPKATKSLSSVASLQPKSVRSTPKQPKRSEKPESVQESEELAEEPGFVMQVDTVFGLPKAIKHVRLVYG